ncbi:hypothetical protein KIW84_013510 [Lathyrus oleraceus]|uniref:Uncharacterized protein n=1 Tax=Pisum sativum TaxID=3888 RepID=A0A9D5BK93_PEA|nr:hypothetical protein KIW84_013510 [Pisum sativum]
MDLFRVSHLSSFSYIDAEDEVGTPFQALSIAEPIEKKSPSFASYRDAKLAIECGVVAGLGKMIELETTNPGLALAILQGSSTIKGCSRVEVSSTPIRARKLLLSWKRMQRTLTTLSSLAESATIGSLWMFLRLILKPIEHNDPTPSPNFEFPVFEAEEDDVEGIPDEITRLLERKEDHSAVS